LVCALVASLLLALPSIAGAATFEVNTANDTETIGETPCVESRPCTLRDAIHRANANPGSDTITFGGITAGSVIHVDESPLPEIFEAVTIEGDTAIGSEPGEVGILLEPIDFEGGTEFVPGISIHAGTGTRIEGLAIGGFGSGIEIGPTENDAPHGTEICGDYLGTERDGETAEPNEVGIQINVGDGAPEEVEGTVIGGTGCAENVISGNSVQGIFDGGKGTTILGNRIGIGREGLGGPVPNGTPGNAESAGVYVDSHASGTVIGSATGINLIGNNDGPGVLVENAASLVTIRHNSFFSNEGKGIEIKQGAPAAPVVASAVSPLGAGLTVEGTVDSQTPGEMVQLEFFGSDNCEKAGEGRTILGSVAVENEGAIPTSFAAHLPVEVPKDERGITVTATYENGATSEFSACAEDQRTYLVNTTAESTEPTECLVVTKCSLRGAIEAANETEVMDTIDFAESAEGVIAPFGGFKIEAPIDIDGTSAPGYEGKPVVEIDGTGETSLGFWLTPGAPGSTVRGLAIGGFSTGVALEGNDQRLCGSYVGVKADGTTALANEVGVSIELGTSGDQVGAGCEMLGDGNLISGNGHEGIAVFGSSAEIAGNRIGVDATGAALPNDGPGIGLEPASSGTTIEPIGLEGANVISQNHGPGVTLQHPANTAQIRRNSIYANEGPGIEIFEEAPVAPTITTVLASPGSTRIKGEVTTPGFEFVELDVYASATCTAGAEGGQTYLGDEGTFSDGGGATEFNVEAEAGLPAGEEFVTVTMTGLGAGQTSEFSECFLAVPATERTFTVNSLGDEGTAAGCEAETDCTLRGAIEAANETESPDTIDFAETAEGAIEVDGSPLPEIRQPVEIDGTSAPGYDESPVVEIDGTESSNEGPVDGLEVGDVGGATIRGLAIGGFSTSGVFLGGDNPSRLCSSWIGFEPDGTTALPNGAGVEVEREALEEQIGVGCGAGAAPNVISANEDFGIEDFGFDTEIGGNRIGVLPGGGVAGNEEGGIRIQEVAEGTVIGSDGTVVGAPESNQITNNDGPGVLVESVLSKAAIRGNSIYANAGPGIEVHEGAPPVPTITAVETGAGTLSFEGEASGGEGEEGLHLDFYASAACGAGTVGGQTFLGSKEITSPGTPTPYEVEFNGSLPAGEEFMTVTETGSVLDQTSEFSECFVFVQPPRTFTVNSLGDGETAAGCIEETGCTLRGALEAANESEALDTIEFAVAGLIEPLTELPSLTEPVEIDATTAPGYAGSPLVEIGGEAELDNDGTEGLVIATGGEGSTIKGLKVAHFDNGIVIDGDHALIEADTVTGNGDIGVAVNTGAPHTAVRRSQIFANGTGELRFETPNSVPEPELEAFVAGSTSTTLIVPIEGALHDHEYAIDVYANAHCDKPGEHGPMEVFLGSGNVTTDSSGKARAEIAGPGLGGIDAEVFTATATDLEAGTTGGIGHCAYSPIDTAIETKPPAQSGSSAATFTFVGETVGRVEGFECSLDGAAFATCSSPKELTGLGDGTHEFQVRAFNGEGTRDFSPATYEWTVEAAAPEISFEAAPPTKTNSTAAKFSFVVSGNPTKVKCKLDGALLQNCGSPVEFSGLAPGTHAFEVFAEDDAGNTTTATREWKIVTEAPSPAITAGPPETTETASATFQFAGAVGSEISGYECSLDGAAFAACTSPQNFSALAPGTHTFSVRANDEAGNTSAPTTYQWTVAPAQVTPPGGEPSNGEKVVVTPTEGKVKVKLPGTNKYVNLNELTEIPVGSVIDVTNGRVKLTSIGPNGTEQSAEFFGGVFKVKQKEGSGLVVLELLDAKVCKAPKGGAPRALASSVAFRPSGRSTGKLWGSGHGSFRTEGHDGSATVEGTIWLVEDRCNGTTFFKTRRGIVKVRDFVSHKTLPLPAGKTYVAGEE
jgi:CSLREA domain-containing protein